MRIKKYIVVAIAVIFCLTGIVFSVFATDTSNESFCIIGDVNGDSEVTASDARLALRVSAQLTELDNDALARADVSFDGKITASDARTILRISALLEPRFAHTYETVVGFAASCDKDGLTDGIVCSFCGETIVAQDAILSVGHDMGDWHTVTQATCVEKGLEKRSCKYEGCDYSETRATDIDNNKHKTEAFFTVDLKADCDNDGIKSHHCEWCDLSLDSVAIPARGHDLVDIVTASDCSSAGTVVSTCSHTDKSEEYAPCALSKTEVIPVDKNGHLWNEGVVSSVSTCNEHGTKTYTCVHNNDHIYTEELELDPAKHSGETEYRDSTVATCTQDGYTGDLYCKGCGVKLGAGDVIPAAGHDYVSVTELPDCTEKGYTTFICTECNDTYVSDYTEETGHSYGEWTTEISPDCTSKGLDKRTCFVCGVEETKIIEELGHDYIESVIAPTCNEKGYTIHTCSACEYYSVSDYTEETGHSYGEWATEIAPDCTSKGLDKRTCFVCGNEETKIIEELGHDYIESVIAPTCNEKGYTVHTCSACEYYSVSDYTEETGHSYGEWSTEIAPDCTSKGLDKRTCFVCGVEETKIIEELGHDYEESVTAPTCTEKGYTTYSCSCGDKYVSYYVDAYDHNLGDWYTVSAATCTENGQERRDCNRCDYFETRETEINPDNHKAESFYTVDVKADCENDGIKSHHCERCDAVLDSAVIEKREHSYNSGEITVAPECTEVGVMTYSCINAQSDEYNVCSHSYTQEIEAVGHDMSEWFITKTATCTEQGQEKRICRSCDYYEIRATATEPDNHKAETFYTVDVKADCENVGLKSYHCERCDKPLYSVTIPARGHDIVSVTTSSTCSDSGETVYTCSKNEETDEYKACSYKKAEVINVDSAKHDWGEWFVETAAGCTSTGVEKRVCKLDSAHFETRIIPVDPDAHKAEDFYTVDVKADCENDGSKSHHCEYCDAKLDSVVISKRNHNYESDVTTEPTCTEDGVTTYTCINAETDEYKVCSHSYTEPIEALGHKIGDWYTVTEPTCSATGLEKRDCKNCDYYETQEIAINPENHKAESFYTVDVKADCENDGSKSHHCEYCDAKLDSVVISKRNHNYESDVTTEPTCTEDGVTTYTCINAETDEYTACNHSYTEPIEALGHKTGDWYTVTEPTCSATGLERCDCQNCDYYETQEIAISPENHKAESFYTVDVKADCENDGSKSHHCEYCDSALDETVIPARKHDIASVTTSATCSSEGKTVSTCANTAETDEYTACSYQKTEIIGIDSTCHDWDEWYVETYATCSVKGLEKRICKLNSEHTETREIPFNSGNHTSGEPETTPASDFESGLSVVKCTQCQKIISQTVIPANIELIGNIEAQYYTSSDDSVYHPESSFGLYAYGYNTNTEADNAQNYPWTYDEATGTFKSTNDGESLSYSTMSVTVSGSGTFGFDYSVSCENSDSFCDGLIFLCDGEPLMSAFGEASDSFSAELDDSQHVLTWIYSKNESVDEGQDCAFIKNISFENVAMASLPTVTVTDANGDTLVTESSVVTAEAGECVLTLSETDSVVSVTVDGESVNVENNSFSVSIDSVSKVVITASKEGCIDNTLNIDLTVESGLSDIVFEADPSATYSFETVTINGETVLRSTNQKKNNSECLMTETLNGEGTFIVTYAVSSQTDKDIFTLKVDGETVISESGYSENDKETALEWKSQAVTLSGGGTHTVVISYSKNLSGNYGLDTAYVKVGSVFNSGVNKISISYDEEMGSVVADNKKIDPETTVAVSAVDTLTLTATPAKKLISSVDGETVVPVVFDGWYVNGELVSTDLTYEFVFMGDSQLKAEFRELTVLPDVLINYDSENHDYSHQDGTIMHHVPYDDSRSYTLMIEDFNVDGCEIYAYDNGEAVTLHAYEGYLRGIIELGDKNHEITVYAQMNDCAVSEVRTVKIIRTAYASQLISESSDAVTVNENVNSDYPWEFSSELSQNGIIAFVPTNSGVHYSVSNISFTVTGSGLFNFYSYLSTEANSDKMVVSVGSPVTDKNGDYVYSGISGWTLHSIDIQAEDDEQTTVYIAYYKDQSDLDTLNQDIIAVSDVAFLSGDVNFTANTVNPEYGSITVISGETDIPVGETVQLAAGSPVTLKATAENSGVFLGWADTNGDLISFDAECTVSLVQSTVVTATFASSKTDYAARVDGVYYKTLEEAMQAAQSGDNVVLLKNWTLTQSITVDEGVTLIVPCRDNDYGYEDNGYNPDGTTTSAFGVTESLYCTLTVPENMTITVNGTLLINAVTGRVVQGNAAYYDVSGGYGKIVLGGNIIVNDGGLLDCAGYIVYSSGVTASAVDSAAKTGNSIVTLMSGATMYETYAVERWRGGTYANYQTYLLQNAYPIYETSMNNMRATLRIESGATLSGTVKMYASGSMHRCRFLQIDNTNGIYRLNEGAYCIRTYEYDSALTSSRGSGSVKTGSYREIYKFYGGASFDNSSITIVGTEVKTDIVTYMNLDGDMSIELYNGEYKINECFQYLPGFVMRAGSGSVVDINSGGGFLFCDSGFYTADSTYSIVAQRYVSGRSDAQFILDPDSTVNCSGIIAGKVVFETDSDGNYASLINSGATTSVTRKIPTQAKLMNSSVSRTFTFTPVCDSYTSYSWPADEKLIWE